MQLHGFFPFVTQYLKFFLSLRQIKQHPENQWNISIMNNAAHKKDNTKNILLIKNSNRKWNALFF